LHGDKDYSSGEKKTLILGHTHPMFKGKRVFLKGVLKDGRGFILMPVYNELVGGPELSDKSCLLGFIFSQEMIKTADVYDLTGKKLGKWL
jgi:metallophosphoesterase superfamily enzyme